MSLSATGQTFDVQGHRGYRGLYPENSLEGFRQAMRRGVTTLELDVVISGDGQVVVSHEPWMSASLCRGTEGQPLEEGKALNLYRMTYDSIRRYDCGSRPQPTFPSQQSMPTYKPLLSEVLATMEEEAAALRRPPLYYNIELKSKANTEGEFHPGPLEFTQRVAKVIADFVPWERVMIQSFDFRVLKVWHEEYPQVNLAVLTAKYMKPRKLQRKLGFIPAIYSPYFRVLSGKRVSEVQEAGIRVIPWTVNLEKDMKVLIGWGVDGIITDYPGRLLDLLVEE